MSATAGHSAPEKSDINTSIGVLRENLSAFTAARDWEQYHTPRSLAMSIAIEAAELMEHYQWHESRPQASDVEETDFQAEVAAELADVVIYCLHFANVTGIDVTEAILAKLAQNESRFPTATYRGKLQPDS